MPPCTSTDTVASTAPIRILPSETTTFPLPEIRSTLPFSVTVSDCTALPRKRISASAPFVTVIALGFTCEVRKITFTPVQTLPNFRRRPFCTQISVLSATSSTSRSSMYCSPELFVA